MIPPRFPISKELAVILGALLLMLFLSPIAGWWATPGLSWLAPYGLWLLVILGAALMHRRDDSDEP
ncbi:MAG: hypothetical protein WBM71_05000 [Sedimenticolaceae bacterium]